MNSIRAALRHPQFRQGAAEMSGLSLGIAAQGLVILGTIISDMVVLVPLKLMLGW